MNSVKKDFFYLILTAFLFFTADMFSQQVTIPNYYMNDEELSKELYKIVSELDLAGDFNVGEDGTEQISFAVIDLTSDIPKLGGVNFDNFIYPASVYKMYVAAEILHQISEGEYSLYKTYVTSNPNMVDKTSEIKTDPRPLLKEGDTVNVNYLLDLMITRSDNSASNCLIDIAQRKNIDKLLHSYGWYGSEVTRKFLNRKFEDPGYENVRGTETCALHSADFMYKVYTNSLVNEWVSLQMKTLLGRQLDKSKLAQGLPHSAMFYHKTGWYSYWTNDVGIVIDGDVKYIISCFMPLEEESALPKFKLLSEKVYELIKSITK
ncbi:MAG: serine hydrolase [Ignavibacteriaceae bacterium]|jgi:beta-lactamase class A|nr:serine hydrolase [Ignavibacteriaceae bacterium]